MPLEGVPEQVGIAHAALVQVSILPTFYNHHELLKYQLSDGFQCFRSQIPSVKDVGISQYTCYLLIY